MFVNYRYFNLCSFIFLITVRNLCNTKYILKLIDFSFYHQLLHIAVNYHQLIIKIHHVFLKHQPRIHLHYAHLAIVLFYLVMLRVQNVKHTFNLVFILLFFKVRLLNGGIRILKNRLILKFIQCIQLFVQLSFVL
jgi:hypothetical protein